MRHATRRTLPSALLLLGLVSCFDAGKNPFGINYFSLTVGPSPITVPAGGSSQVSVTVVLGFGLGDFSVDVSLAPPPGIEASFTDFTLPISGSLTRIFHLDEGESGTAPAYVRVASSTAPGTYTVVVDGTCCSSRDGEDERRSTSFDVVVVAATVATLPSIVFESMRDMNSEIYVINPDQTGLMRLTTDPAQDREPVWSDDRMKIAFVSDRDGNDEIYTMSANGMNQVKLTTLADARRPAYSPDGTRIAFDSDTDGDEEVFVMNVDGTGVTQLTANTTDDDQGPTWSELSTEIVFTTLRDGDDNLYVMDANGTGQSLLVDTGEHDLQPDWSPDGTRIVFTQQGIVSGNDEIFVVNVNADGITGLLQLTSNAATDEEPTWSPDGNWIAFTSDRGGNRDIYIMTSDGGNVTQVTTNAFDDSRPSWVH